MSVTANRGLVLVVDDEHLSRRLVGSILSSLQEEHQDSQYEVLYAEDGSEALDMVNQYRPDIVLLDRMIPQITGEEVCRQIKANPLLKDTKVIFVSARGSIHDKIEGLSLGADDYLSKPFYSEELIAKLRIHYRSKLETEHLQSCLTQAQREASLGQMVSGISHDFINILQNLEISKLILKSSQSIEKKLDSVESPLQTQQLVSAATLKPIAEQIELIRGELSKIQEYCHHIRDTKQLGDHIAGGLLNYSAQKQENEAPHFLEALMNSLLNVFQRRFHQEGIHVVLDVQEGLPKLGCNAVEIQQVFLNLFLNAMQAMEQSPKKELSIKIWEEKNQQKIQVADTGHGMSPQLQKQVFEKNFSTRASRESTSTRGIGLATVQRIVGQHQGDIDIQSQEGQGTTFTITLPQAE